MNIKPAFFANTVWRLVDWKWVCISHDIDKTLADYLSGFGFVIPDTIKYCLAENDTYAIKFRQSGGAIYIYINSL